MILISNFITIGIQIRCYDYGQYCHENKSIERVIWFFYIIALLNVVIELLNILLLYKRARSRINLILGKIERKI